MDEENKEIKEMIELDRNKFKDKEKYFYFALNEIEKHIPELKDLKNKKDNKLNSELIDVYVWAKILLETHKIKDKDILKRLNRFKEKSRR